MQLAQRTVLRCTLENDSPCIFHAMHNENVRFAILVHTRNLPQWRNQGFTLRFRLLSMGATSAFRTVSVIGDVTPIQIAQR